MAEENMEFLPFAAAVAIGADRDVTATRAHGDAAGALTVGADQPHIHARRVNISRAAHGPFGT